MTPINTSTILPAKACSINTIGHSISNKTRLMVKQYLKNLEQQCNLACKCVQRYYKSDEEGHSHKIMVMGRMGKKTCQDSYLSWCIGQVKGSQSSSLLCSQFTYILFCMHGCYIIKIIILNKCMKDVICQQVRFCPGLTVGLHNGNQQELSAHLRR